VNTRSPKGPGPQQVKATKRKKKKVWGSMRKRLIQQVCNGEGEEKQKGRGRDWPLGTISLLNLRKFTKKMAGNEELSKEGEIPSK